MAQDKDDREIRGVVHVGEHQVAKFVMPDGTTWQVCAMMDPLEGWQLDVVLLEDPRCVKLTMQCVKLTMQPVDPIRVKLCSR